MPQSGGVYAPRYGAVNTAFVASTLGEAPSVQDYEEAQMPGPLRLTVGGFGRLGVLANALLLPVLASIPFTGMSAA